MLEKYNSQSWLIVIIIIIINVKTAA